MYTNIVDSRKPRMYTNIVELSVGLIVYDIRILIRTTGMAYYRFRLLGLAWYTIQIDRRSCLASLDRQGCTRNVDRRGISISSLFLVSPPHSPKAKKAYQRNLYDGGAHTDRRTETHSAAVLLPDHAVQKYCLDRSKMYFFKFIYENH